MKRYIESEVGYTLLIVLLVIVLFSVIGSSLMLANISGAKKNVSRESIVQSQDLAVKGQDYLVQKLEYDLNQALREGKNANEFVVALEQVIHHYTCPSANVVTDRVGKKLLRTDQLQTLPERMSSVNETGQAYYCVIGWQNVSPMNPYKKLVTIQTVGDSNKIAENRYYHTETQYNIGSNLVMEPFNYVISSQKDEQLHGGNISLDGGINVAGNVNVANDFQTTNQSYFKGIRVQSIKPTFTNSQVHVEGNYTSNFYEPAFSSAVTTVKKDIEYNDLFDIQKMIDNHQDILTEGMSAKNLGLTGSALDYISKTAIITGMTANESSIYLANLFDGGFGEAERWNYLFNAQNSFKNIYFPRDVKIRYSTLSLSNPFTAKLKVDSAYIGRDFYIGYLDGTDNTFKALLENPNEAVMNYDQFLLEGTRTRVILEGDYYVEGDVTMTNVILEGNFNLYVNGRVGIYFSSFDDVEGNIFANGDVTMRYIANQNNPTVTRVRPFSGVNDVEGVDPDKETNAEQSVWNGFIYSASKVMIDTPTSYMRINGGVHGKEVKLSSVRGRSKTSCVGWIHNNRELVRYPQELLVPYSNCFDSESNQKKNEVEFYKLIPLRGLAGELLVSKYISPMQSRLQLQYDPNFIMNYLSNKRIYRVDPSKINNQSIIE